MTKTLEKIYLFKQLFFKRSELEQVLLLSCSFSISMACARVVYTKELMFLFLIWNLFLAYLPYWVSNFITQQFHRLKSKWILSILLVIWLFFIPNAFYIVTDLFHLRSTDVIPLWFDLALIFSFAWNGLLLGIASVRHIEKLLEQHVAIKYEWLFVYPIMFLNALGVYIGRYLRFNSWDVVTNPFSLASDIFHLVTHPIHYRFDWSMIFCFSILMTLFYITTKKLSKAVY